LKGETVAEKDCRTDREDEAVVDAEKEEEEAVEDGIKAKDSDENAVAEYTTTQDVDSRAADQIESKNVAAGAESALKKDSADLPADGEAATDSARGVKVPLAHDETPEEEEEEDVPAPINPTESPTAARKEEDGSNFAWKDNGTLKQVSQDNSSAAPVADESSSVASLNFGDPPGEVADDSE
jgi:hypothetical protein